MITFLMVFFVILSFLLCTIILIQPAKGDMGLGSLASKSSQMLFGGSGGKDVFEKATWIMGFIFVFGALGLALLKNRETETSRLKNVVSRSIPENVPAQAPKQ